MEGDACWEGLVDYALAFLEEFGGESAFEDALVSHVSLDVMQYRGRQI